MLEVGPRGLIVEGKLMELKEAINVSKPDIVQLGMTLSIARCAVLGSFDLV